MCTGILEFSLLVSAILSTYNISIKQRLKGFLYSLGVVILFNLFRIVITIFIIVNLNLKIANFFHGFLFRIFLVIIVLGTYYFWLRYIK
jgi:exosortase/archaeosortase family protein